MSTTHDLYDQLQRNYERLKAENIILEATLSKFMPDSICSYCDKPTNSLAANPSLWPVVFCDPGSGGKPSAHHAGCVHERMAEVERLRAAIRQHRDQRGDDRCWLDDARLYRSLGADPEDCNIDGTLPPKCEFLKSCERYWEQRQSANEKLSSEASAMTVAQLEAEIARLKAELDLWHSIFDHRTPREESGDIPYFDVAGFVRAKLAELHPELFHKAD